MYQQHEKNEFLGVMQELNDYADDGSELHIDVDKANSY